MDGDVRVEVEEGGGGEGAEAVEAGEDFVEEDGEAGPVWGGVSMGVEGGMWGGLTVGVGGGIDGGEGVGADDFDEFALEEGVARGRFVSIRWVGMGGITYTNIMPPAPRRIGSITRAPNFRP